MATTIAEYIANITMRGINDGVGLPNTVNSFQVDGKEGLFELPVGGQGDPGPQGEPAWPWKWQGDVADEVALEALREALLGIEQKGYAYRVVSTNTVMYWDGEAWYPFLNAFGAEGPQGAPNELTVGTVTTGAEGSNVSVSITGTPPNQVLNITIPRGGQGAKGDPGGPGPILQADDVDGSVLPQQDYVLAWDEPTQKWRPMPYPGWRGPWGISGGSVSSGSNVSAQVSTLGSITIPAQPVAWRPFVQGQVSCQIHVSTVGEARADVIARIGSTTGQIIGVGPGFPSADHFFARLLPNFQTSLDPSSSVGVVPAGQTTTIYFTLERAGATKSYSWTNSGASFLVWACPVYSP